MVHEKNKTIQKKCTQCGVIFDAPAVSKDTRTVYTCSDTCRGHHYRDIKDTEKILKSIKKNNSGTLKCSIKRVIDLGFTISISR